VLTALAPFKSRLPQTLRLVGSPRDEDELAAAVALVRGGRLTTLQLPLEDFVDETVAALRKAVATVEDCDTQFLPSAYNLDALLLKPAAGASRSPRCDSRRFLTRSLVMCTSSACRRSLTRRSGRTVVEGSWAQTATSRAWASTRSGPGAT